MSQDSEEHYILLPIISVYQEHEPIANVQQNMKGIVKGWFHCMESADSLQTTVHYYTAHVQSTTEFTLC